MVKATSVFSLAEMGAHMTSTPFHGVCYKRKRFFVGVLAKYIRRHEIRGDYNFSHRNTTSSSTLDSDAHAELPMTPWHRGDVATAIVCVACENGVYA